MEVNAIKKLGEEVVNRIAAGEIIQRPANACKELIENSLDAKASQIQITVKSGGLKLLQVEDNGTGIHPSNLEIVCERFTTSKISKFEDISKIDTFGFRGEALASISHVAHLFIQTKTAQNPWGFRATYENGKLQERPKRCAAKQGTIIRIEDLFYNMPQRRCCLHSASEEYQKICDVFSKYAVHNSHIAFMLQKFNEQPTIKTRVNSSKEQNIRSIYGARIAENLLCIEMENNKAGIFKMKALITTAQYFGKSPHFILFINHRLAESTGLRNSIESAYKAHIPKGMHPFVYIELQMNPLNIDVNVHPTKKQVNFLYEDEIIESIRVQVEIHLWDSKHTRSLYKQLKFSGLQTCDSERLTSRTYAKDMVRTDSAEQQLETFLVHNLLETPEASKISDIHCSTQKLLQPKIHKGSRLSSIIRIKNQMKCDVSFSLRKVLKGIVFVGAISKSLALFQVETSLCICNTTKLSEQLFYQLFLYKFQNFSCIKIEPKLPVKQLIFLALKRKHRNCHKDMRNEMAEQATLLLKNKAHIMREYFGLYINSEGELEYLPVLLPNHYPSVYCLPKYLLRLTTKVEWRTEQKCFETFSKETAHFYAAISEYEFKTKNKEKKWIMEHVIYPALKRFLQPPPCLKKYIYQLTTLPKLYKVFERC